jgi:flagellar protein FliO/FliZ
MDMYYYLKFIAALIFVLALMGGLAYVLKRLGYGQGAMLSTAKKRLKIIEILPLDGRRKAVILQRDDKQHLVLLGVSGETVVETDIQNISSALADKAKEKNAA